MVEAALDVAAGPARLTEELGRTPTPEEIAPRARLGKKKRPDPQEGDQDLQRHAADRINRGGVALGNMVMDREAKWARTSAGRKRLPAHCWTCDHDGQREARLLRCGSVR